MGYQDESQDHISKGRNFAKILGEVGEKLKDGERLKDGTITPGTNVYCEPRLSIYGSTKDDWVNLAKWANNNKKDVYQDRFMWMIQLPRIFHIHKKYGKVNNFKEMLQNIFKPLFEATLDPNGEADPDNKIIADFLLKIVAFDSVDNENKPDKLVTRKRLPKDWTKQDPPPYSYYAYYFWANLYQLNALRATLGLNTFKTRPHCGESGDTHHLATMFLLADGINHGIKLALEPSIQYLYYLTQIGISVSPLSNNALFMKIEENPFYNFLERGLNVTLSTDDPLQFHTCNTSNALMEEYVVAKATWSLTLTDLAEITRNSVLQSGFSHRKKQEYIGNHYRIGGVVGNEEGKTGIPKCRSAFRSETLLAELDNIRVKKDIPAKDTPWKWKPGCPVTWKDLVGKEPTSRSHAPETPIGRRAHGVSRIRQ